MKAGGLAEALPLERALQVQVELLLPVQLLANRLRDGLGVLLLAALPVSGGPCAGFLAGSSPPGAPAVGALRKLQDARRVELPL